MAESHFEGSAKDFILYDAMFFLRFAFVKKTVKVNQRPIKIVFFLYCSLISTFTKPSSS